MSNAPSDLPDRNKALSDEALLETHEVSGSASGSGKLTALVFVVSLILCFAGVYLERNSADFSVLAYNEDARGSGAPGGAAKPVDMVAFGKKQFLSACVTCHQATGLGLPGTYPPLAGSEWVQGSEERLVRIVLFGLTGPLKVAGHEFPGTTPMPSFGKVPGSGYNWRDDQIAAVLTYIRQEWGNKAPAVSKTNRTQPWTVHELESFP
jgi:mono/diheme cytochrome c family protein